MQPQIETIAPVAQAELDQVVDAVIQKYQDNSKAIIRLALETIVALTASEGRIKEITSQGFFARALNSVLGKNNRLRDGITTNLALAQYTALQMLYKITEQNLLQLEFSSAINQKLNQLAVNLDPETLDILVRLASVYEQIGTDLCELEKRVARLEHLVDCLAQQFQGKNKR